MVRGFLLPIQSAGFNGGPNISETDINPKSGGANILCLTIFHQNCMLVCLGMKGCILDPLLGFISQ